MVVEQVNYEVNWKAFKRGYSIFVPSLNPSLAKQPYSKSAVNKYLTKEYKKLKKK